MLSASSSKMAPALAKESDFTGASHGSQSVLGGNEQTKEETWSTILQGVASTKIVPTKNVLILGMRRSIMRKTDRMWNIMMLVYM